MSDKLLSRLANSCWRQPTRRIRFYFKLLPYRLRVLRGVNPERRYVDTGGTFESNGIVASVLLPSRGRVEMLRETLKNIANTCGDASKVEILVYLDDDDAESLAEQESFYAAAGAVKLKIIVGARGKGYAEFHLFINRLASEAQGDFLILHNDDAYFASHNWVDAIAKWQSKFVILNFDHDKNKLNPFPAVHRKIIEILGHFSLHSSCDLWMLGVGNNIGLRQKDLSVKMTHRSREADWQPDKTYEEVQAFYPYVDDSFAAMEEDRMYDIALLYEHIRKHGRTLRIKKMKDRTT